MKKLNDDEWFATCNGCGDELRENEVAYTNTNDGESYCYDCNVAIQDDNESSGRMKLKVGDTVEVYIPIGDGPFRADILKIVKVDYDEALAYLEDNSSVGIGYCKKLF